MTFELFWQVTALMVGLFVLGSIACLPLFKWNLREFFRSRLWVKIYWWWPIYLVFLVVLLVGWPAALVVVVILLLQALREWYDRKAYNVILPSLYVCLFVFALIQLIGISRLASDDQAIGLISICLASVLSDVCAFFAGSYVGKHSLPKWINPGKSWEGVLGQIIGAFVGMGLAAVTTEIDFSWLLAIVVGVASALGDLLNSVAKRRLSIKDWSQFIPGHGGVLDRFSSLSFALAAGYIVLLLR